MSHEIKTTVLLLAEDELLIRVTLEEDLIDQGFEVVLAANGTEALHELDQDATRFRAVITDIRLGDGPDGWDIGRHARELVPDMPVVYVSSDGSDWSSKGVPKSVLIAKPFVSAQVITALATLLNEVDALRSGTTT